MFKFCIICLMALSVLAAGCAPALSPLQVTSAAAKPTTVPPTATLPAPTATEVRATETPAASIPQTAASTATSTPAATVTSTASILGQSSGPLAAQAIKELAGWCLPADAAVSYAKDPLSPSKNARMGHIGQNNLLVVRNMPSNGCVFVYTFTQAAPSGVKLEISELKQSKAFYTIDLQPVSSRPDVLYAFVRHSFVITPPGDGIQLAFVVKDSLGQLLRRDQVNLYNWVPGTPAPKEEDEGNCGCTLPLP